MPTRSFLALRILSRCDSAVEPPADEDEDLLLEVQPAAPIATTASATARRTHRFRRTLITPRSLARLPNAYRTYRPTGHGRRRPPPAVRRCGGGGASPGAHDCASCWQGGRSVPAGAPAPSRGRRARG